MNYFSVCDTKFKWLKSACLISLCVFLFFQFHPSISLCSSCIKKQIYSLFILCARIYFSCPLHNLQYYLLCMTYLLHNINILCAGHTVELRYLEYQYHVDMWFVSPNLIFLKIPRFYCTISYAQFSLIPTTCHYCLISTIYYLVRTTHPMQRAWYLVCTTYDCDIIKYFVKYQWSMYM